MQSCKSYQAASSDGITYNEQGCCNRVKISNQINYNGEYEMIYDENRTWKIERLRSKKKLDSDWLNLSQSADL